ncbi:MAG: CidA/LrgA family protein [Cyanobacteria bacterium J06639_1]
MTFLHGIALLLSYELLGEAIAFHLPIPGPVLGMAFLFLTLWLRRQPVPESLATASTSLLSHLPLLFVPAGVGVMVHGDRIAAEWLPVLAALIFGTLFVAISTAAVMAATKALWTQSRHA